MGGVGRGFRNGDGADVVEFFWGEVAEGSELIRGAVGSDCTGFDKDGDLEVRHWGNLRGGVNLGGVGGGFG